MRVSAFVLLAGLLGFVAGCGKKEGSSGPTATGPSDQDKMQGVWKIETIDVGGDPKEGPPKAFIEKMRFAVKGDRFYFIEDDGYAKEEQFTLDSTKEPKHMTSTRLDDDGKPLKRGRFKNGKYEESGDLVVENIYKFDGDKLVIAVSEGDKAVRPTEFKARVPDKFDPANPDKPNYGIAVLTLVKAGDTVPEIKKRPKPKAIPGSAKDIEIKTSTPKISEPLPPLSKDVPVGTPTLPDAKLPEAPLPKIPDVPEKK